MWPSFRLYEAMLAIHAIYLILPPHIAELIGTAWCLRCTISFIWQISSGLNFQEHTPLLSSSWSEIHVNPSCNTTTSQDNISGVHSIFNAPFILWVQIGILPQTKLKILMTLANRYWINSSRTRSRFQLTYPILYPTRIFSVRSTPISDMMTVKPILPLDDYFDFFYGVHKIT